MYCSPPGFSVHGIFQARIMKNIFISHSRESFIQGSNLSLASPALAGRFFTTSTTWGFWGCSAGKESTCNAGGPSWIAALGRSPGEGIGYLFQYSWASPVAQMVKNLPTMRETWVRILGWEDTLEEGMTTHSGILARRISNGERSLADYSPWGCKALDMTERRTTTSIDCPSWK